MDEQEFLSGVHIKINTLKHERSELEFIQERQKRLFYKQIKMYLLPFLVVIVLAICTVTFQIGIGVTAFISFFILTIIVWIETMEFEVENIGVRQNGYNHK